MRPRSRLRNTLAILVLIVAALLGLRTWMQSPTTIDLGPFLAETSQQDAPVAQRNGDESAMIQTEMLVYQVRRQLLEIVPCRRTDGTPTWTIRDYAGLNKILDEAIQRGQASKIMAPRIVAISGQVATLFSGQQVPIMLDANNANSGVSFRTLGVVIEMTATELVEKAVRVEIAPSVSYQDPSEESEDINPDTRKPLPALRQVSAKFQHFLKPGESVLFCGIPHQGKYVNEIRIPVLSEIPGLGDLFRFRRETQEDMDLLIVARPYFIDRPPPVQVPIPFRAAMPVPAPAVRAK